MSAPEAVSSPTLRPVLRTASYAVVHDPAGRILLARASERSDLQGRWFLPGGGLRHGEHPRDGALRELLEETGLVGVSATVRTATSDLLDLPHRGVRVHTLRLVYDVTLDPSSPVPALRSEADGTSDLARFADLAEAGQLLLMPFVAEVLGLPEPPPVVATVPERPEPLADPVPLPETGPGSGIVEEGDAQPVRVQRPAAYAVLVDDSPGQEPQILLSRLAGTDGLWTLPGGGIDFGEPPVVALIREMHEETGLPYTPGPLIDIGSRHFTGRSPGGRMEDFHGVRLIYAGSVPFGTPPQVIEVDGSTDLAAWVPISELPQIRAVSTVHDALTIWTDRRGQG